MMGKEEDERLLEAIDPMFANVFSKKRKNEEDKCASSCGHLNGPVTQVRSELNSDDRFCDLLARQLSNFLEKKIKFVCRDDSHYSPPPVEGGIRLFSHSQLLHSLEMEEEATTTKRRKKHVLVPKSKEKLTKEEKDRRFEEAAVSYEWVLEQSKIYNSL